MCDEFDQSIEIIDGIRGIAKRKDRMAAIQRIIQNPDVSEIAKEQVRGFFWVDHPEYIAPWNKIDMFFSSKFSGMKSNGARRSYANAVLNNPSTSKDSRLAVKKVMVARPWMFDESEGGFR